MHRRLFAGALAAVMLLGGLITSATASAPSTVTLIGSRTVSAIVDLPALPGLGGASTSSLDAHVGGSYAGYMIYTLHGEHAQWPLRGQIAVPGLRLGAHWAFPISEEAVPAGRYRVVLFADGPTKITLPALSGGRVVLRPQRPVRAFGTLISVAPSASGFDVDDMSSKRMAPGLWQEGGMDLSWTTGPGGGSFRSLCLTAQPDCLHNELAPDGPSVQAPVTGQSAGGYNFAGFDTVDLSIDRGDYLRAQSSDVHGSERGFMWGVGGS
jgi:hypothetical protein